MRTIEKNTVSRKASTEKKTLEIEWPTGLYKQVQKRAKRQGITPDQFVENAMKNHLAEVVMQVAAAPIQVLIPHAKRKFITELYEAAGLTFESYLGDMIGLLEGELLDALKASPVCGLRDNIAELTSMETADSDAVKAVLARWRPIFIGC